MTLRSVRLPLALFVDLLWAYAAVAIVAAVFGRGQGPAPSIAAVAAVVVGSFALSRLLQATDLADTQFRALGVAVSVISIFAIVHTEYAASVPPWDPGWVRALIIDAGHGNAHVVAATVAMTAIWMRGVVRGREGSDSHGALGGIAFGIVPVAIAAAVAPRVHGPDAFGFVAIIYLVLALGVLALYQAPDPDRLLRSYAAQWSVAVAAVLAIAGALTVIAAAVDPAGLGFVAPVGKPLAYLAGAAALYILGPPLAAIGWLFSLIPLPHHMAQDQPAQNMPLGKQPEESDTPRWMRIAAWIVAGGLLTLVVAASLIALWLLFRRFAKQKEEDGDRRERVEADSSLADDLVAAFDALARRFRRAPMSTRSSIEVRRLYHEVLARSAASGLERPPAATPLQFAPYLDTHFASDAPSAISRAFAASRYGAHDCDPVVLNDLRDRWRQIVTSRAL
jgi:hypothetical protein